MPFRPHDKEIQDGMPSFRHNYLYPLFSSRLRKSRLKVIIEDRLQLPFNMSAFVESLKLDVNISVKKACNPPLARIPNILTLISCHIVFQNWGQFVFPDEKIKLLINLPFCCSKMYYCINWEKPILNC